MQMWREMRSRIETACIVAEFCEWSLKGLKFACQLARSTELLTRLGPTFISSKLATEC